MANEALPLAGQRGRHRSPGALGRAVTKAADAARSLSALSPRWRFLDQPFELMAALGAIVSGAPVAWGATRPESLAAHLSPWMVRSWGAMLCLGGIATMTARIRVARARSDPGLIAASRLEVVGLLLFATVLGMYGTAILALGSRGLAVGPMAAGWGVACAVRARIVVKQLAELTGIVRTGTGDG